MMPIFRSKFLNSKAKALILISARPNFIVLN